MEKLINNKKYLTLILIGLLTLVIGISLSFIMFDLSGSDNSIKTGQITMTYIEPSNEVVLKDQLPISDELGKNSDKYFEFSVMSNATTNENDKTGVNIFYEISLSKKDVEQIYNELEDNQVKIYLTKVVGEEEKVVVDPILISELEKSNYGESLKIYDAKNKHHSNNGTITTKYRLRFWIDNEVNASDWYLKNKYEYRFVVNVNGHAPNLDLINDNTLATKIKTMYTVENKTAVEEDGYHYLKGTETIDISNDPSLQLLSMYGMLGNVYLYRQEVDNGNVEPVSNVKIVNDAKEYTYNQELLESDVRNYMISSGNVSESMYDQMTGPFGGYVNAILGMLSGVVTSDMQYAEGKTINDIPTLDEAMADGTMSSSIIEMFEEIMSELIANSKDSFIQLYKKGDVIDEELLNSNLALGVDAMGASDMGSIINTNFGSITNYALAQVYELITYDDNANPVLIDGKTIEDIPSLESALLTSEEKILLTNTYVELNNMLWKVVGVNSDNSVKLMSVYQVQFEDKESFKTGNVSKYFGFNNNAAPFLTLLKDTTLEDIIIKTEYKYEEDGKVKKVLAYASMPTYEDIKNTVVGTKSYLHDFEEDSIYVASKSTEYGYKYITMSYSGDNELYEGNYSYIHFNPVITIENIDVVGEGTKSNPYKLINEETVTEENFVKSLLDLNMNIENGKNIDLYRNMGFDYNLDYSRDYYENYGNGPYAVSLSINNKCYYLTKEGYSEVIDYAGSCYDKYVSLNSLGDVNINTYSFNETTFTITGENIKEYQWQQEVGNEWINLEDYAGRISGTKTAALTIIPTSIYEKETKFRCVVNNGISKYTSEEYTMNLTLTDGEFVYEEIGDTNKYQITSYVGDYTNSIYFTQNQEDNTLYDFVIPANINGDLITNVMSFENSTILGSSTYNNAKSKIKTVKLDNGIEEVYAIISGDYITEVLLNDTLEKIGDGVFERARLSTIKFPDVLKYIGGNAFYSSNIIELNLPNNLIEIGNSAFFSSELTSLEIPDSIIKIGNSAFYCARLKSLVIPDNIETIGTRAFYLSPLESIEFLTKKLKTISSYTFYSSQLKELIIPFGVETIGISAFYSSPLTKLILPEGLKKIEGIGIQNEAMYTFNYKYGAFGCAVLEELELPSTLELIGTGAFSNSLIKELVIPSSVKEISEAAFYSSPLTKLTLNEGLEMIGAISFYSSQLTSLEIPSSVEIIRGAAFYSSPLTKLTLNEGLVSILGLREYYASKGGSVKYYGTFEKAKLTELKLPSTLNMIGSRAFFSSPLTELQLPENLTYIEELAFCHSKLTELEIPASVERIKAGAFYNSPLTRLTLHEGLNILESEYDWYFQNGYAPQMRYQYYGVFENAQLTELSLPRSLYKLQSYTFYNSRFTDLKVYGRTTLYDFIGYEKDKTIIMEDGYEPQFIEGTLE